MQVIFRRNTIQIIKLILLALFLMANKHGDNMIYGISFKAINEKDVIKLSDYKGKVILIVNTASECGFTKQYAQLEKIWQKYKDQGLVIIGVPSDDFGHQEPGSNDEIAHFCEINYGVTFPLTEKTIVSGDNAHPFFKMTKEHFGFLSGPKWNFYKYLIGPDGQLIDWFASQTTPDSNKIIQRIEDLLKVK